jgi:flagellar FliJ protein
MPFTFSLEPVLEHRRRLEQNCQRQCGDAMARVEAVRERQQRLQNEIERQHEEIRAGQRSRHTGGSAFALRQMAERWIVAQRGQVDQLQGAIDRLNEELRVARERLIEAVKDRMVIEKLREKELDAHRRREARAEMKTFDEIAVREYLNEQRREKDADHTERIAR